MKKLLKSLSATRETNLPTINGAHAFILHIILSVLLIFLLQGCQKNSYESCVEYQTAAGTRFHREYPNLSSDLQRTIDNHVAVNCRGIK